MAKKDKDKLDEFWDKINFDDDDDKKSEKTKSNLIKNREKFIENKDDIDDKKKITSDKEDKNDDFWLNFEKNDRNPKEDKKRKNIWDDDDDDDDFDLEWLKKYTKTEENENTKNDLTQHESQITPSIGKIAHTTPIVGMNAPIIENKEQKIKLWLYVMLSITVIVICASIGATGWMYYNLDHNKHCHGSNVILAKMYTGDPILVNVQDVKRGSHILSRGYIDSQISTLMYRFVRPNDTVIDIGSGFGYYTMYLARIVGPRGHVYSFEARKETYDLLVSSIKINNFYNVHTYHNLLFSSEADVLLDTKDKDNVSNFGTARIIIDYSQIPTDSETRRMKTQPLDAVLPDIGHVSLMHINARGNELSIITGARHLIARSPGIKIIISWDKKALQEHVNVSQIVNQFFQLGFHFWLINNDNGELVELLRGEDVINIDKGRLLIAKNLL